MEVVSIGGGDRNPTLQVLATIRGLSDLRHRAVNDVRTMARYVDSTNDSVKRMAEAAMAAVASATRLPRYAGPPKPRHGAFILTGVRRYEAWIASVQQRVAVLQGVGDRIETHWVMVWLALTGMTCIAITNQWWAVAAGVVLFRVGASTLLGRTHNLPLETRSFRKDNGLLIVTRCLTAHLGDVAVMLTIAWTLTLNARPRWAALFVCTAMFMLLATLYRVAALQVGVQIIRPRSERLFRVGALVAALLLAGVHQPAIPARTYPLLGIAAAGALLYALLEAAAVTWFIVDNERHAAEMESVRVTVVREDDAAVEIRSGEEPTFELIA